MGRVLEEESGLSNRLQRIVGGVATSLVAVVIVACSAEGSSVDLSAADSDQAFSLFLGENLAHIDFAQMKLRNNCLNERGYPQNLNAMADEPINPFRYLIVTEGTFGPPSETQARKVGFGRDWPAEPPPVVSFDPSYDRAYQWCTDFAWRQLSGDAKRIYYAYFDLGNKLGQPLLQMVNERVDSQARAGMLSCLADRNYRPTNDEEFLEAPNPGLFGIPIAVEEPTAAEGWRPKAIPGTVEVGPAMPRLPYRPSSLESSFAVAWHRCARDSGLLAEQMKAASAVQRELVAKYESSFLELNPRIVQVAKDASALIGKA